MYLQTEFDERPFAAIRCWLFWHQPRSWRSRAFMRTANRLRRDYWALSLEYWQRDMLQPPHFNGPRDRLQIHTFKSLR